MYSPSGPARSRKLIERGKGERAWAVSEPDIDLFPRSAWEQAAGRSASREFPAAKRATEKRRASQTTFPRGAWE